VEREIEDLRAVISAAGPSAAVFGNSSGAVLALRAAGGRSSHQQAGALGATLVRGSGRPAPVEGLRNQAHRTIAAGRRGDAMALFMSTVGVPQEAIAGMRRSPGWPGMEAVAPTLAYDAAVMGDSSVPTGLISSVKVPTLVLTGGDTGAWADSAARALIATMPLSEHRVLEHQTHAVAWMFWLPNCGGTLEHRTEVRCAGRIGKYRVPEIAARIPVRIASAKRLITSSACSPNRWAPKIRPVPPRRASCNPYVAVRPVARYTNPRCLRGGRKTQALGAGHLFGETDSCQWRRGEDHTGDTSVVRDSVVPLRRCWHDGALHPGHRRQRKPAAGNRVAAA